MREFTSKINNIKILFYDVNKILIIFREEFVFNININNIYIF